MKNEDVKELEISIRYHNQKYTDGEPEISDAEYDELVEKLKKLDPKNPILFEVGATPSYGKKIVHDIPMGSLSKINTIEALEKWQSEHPDRLVWSPKIDGGAAELIYKKGKLVQVSSRGNGKEGQSLIDNVQYIDSIPLILDKPIDLRIRGEFYIPKSFFNEHLAKDFANPRNSVAGAVHLKNPSETVNFGVQFFGYKLIDDNIKSMTEAEKYANSITGKHGNKAAKLNFVELHTEKLTKEVIEEYQNKLRAELDFEIDGLVVTVDDVEAFESYGILSERYPKGAIAFKFKAEQVITTINDVEWNVGRTGRIIPVAILEPVNLMGSIISRSALHSFGEMKRMRISNGDKILLQKSGDIIPYIVRVVEQASHNIPQSYPTVCPECGIMTINDGINIYCTNDNCPAKICQKIEYYLKTIGVKEIGAAMINMLHSNNKINDISDLYSIEKGFIANQPGYGERSEKIFYDAISNVKKVSLAVFLTSLGIEGIGNTTGKLLAKKFKTLDEVLKITKGELVDIEGIGDITASQIVDGFKTNNRLISKMRNILQIEENSVKVGVLNGKTICCTGTLSIKRSDFQKIIEDYGGEYGSINKLLKILVIGEGAVPAKIEKAKKYGAIVMTEDEFKKLI